MAKSLGQARRRVPVYQVFAEAPNNGKHSFCSDPEHLVEPCEKSLARLGVGTVDLYYCHAVDGVTPIEKTIEAIVEL